MGHVACPRWTVRYVLKPRVAAVYSPALLPSTSHGTERPAGKQHRGGRRASQLHFGGRPCCTRPWLDRLGLVVRDATTLGFRVSRF